MCFKILTIKECILLQSLDGFRFPNLFGILMESTTLCDIIHVLYLFIEKKGSVYPYIKGLSQIKRIYTLSSFMSASDQSGNMYFELITILLTYHKSILCICLWIMLYP